MFETYLYGEYDIEEALEKSSSNIIRLMYQFISHNNEMPEVLIATCKLRSALMTTIAEQEDEEEENLLNGTEAEETFIRFYKQLYKKQWPEKSADDIMETYDACWVPWQECNFTRSELVAVAKAVVGYDIQVMNDLKRYYEAGLLDT